MSAGAAMIHTLEQFDVDRVFGIPGHHILDLYDHLGESDIHHVMGKNEEGVVRSANAAARTTGEPAVALVSAGPGAINAMTGIGEATALSLPLVVIAGAEPTRDGPHNVDEPVAVPNMFSDIAKTHLPVEHPPDVVPALRRAFKLAQEGKPGPVVVQVPMDVMKTSIHVDSLPDRPEPAKLRPNEKRLDKLAGAIDDADRPFVVVGQGGLRADIPQIIGLLADAIDAPVVVTQRGFSGYVTAPRYAGGFTPTMQHVPAQGVLEGGDLLVGVGMREGLRRYYDEAFEGEAVHLLERLERHSITGPAVVGDLESSVSTLANRCDEQTYGWWRESVSDGWEQERRNREQILQNPTEATTDRPDETSGSTQLLGAVDPLHPIQVMEAINEHKDSDALMTTDVGVHTTYAMRYLELTEPNSFFGPGNWGAMGHALPAAIGANIAAPDRQVIAVAGDGGLLMTLPEFKTAVEENLDITVVVVNNNQHNAIFADQLDQYGRSDYTEVPGFDYTVFAESAGGAGFTVREPDELEQKVDAALSTDAPSIVDVPVVPNVTLA